MGLLIAINTQREAGKALTDSMTIASSGPAGQKEKSLQRMKYFFPLFPNVCSYAAILRLSFQMHLEQ